MKALYLCMAMLVTCGLLSAGIAYSYELSDAVIAETEHGLRISLDGAYSAGEPGEPDLPWIGYKLLMPVGNEAIKLEVKRSGARRYKLDNIVMPLQKQHPLSQKGPIAWDQPNLEIYHSSQSFPAKIDRGFQTEFMNGHPIAFGRVSPFEYRPLENELILYTRIDLDLSYAPSNRASQAMNLLKKDSFVARRLLQSVDNHRDVPQYRVTRDEGYEYLMIVDQQKLGNWQPLADFYESRGISVMMQSVGEIYSTIAGLDEQDKIRNFIIDAYENNPLRHVLLGGDIDVIPHRGLYVNMGYQGEMDDDIPADMYYSCLDGNWNDNGNDYWGEPDEADLVPELAIGRICYNSDIEIANQINKISMYQLAPVVDNIRSSAFVGEWLWDGPTWGGDYMDEMIGGSNSHGYSTTGVPNDWDIDTLYDRTYGSSGAWGSYQILPLLSEGANLVNHLGHSATTYNMRLSNHQATQNSITNDGASQNFSIYFTQGCYAGSFDNRGTNPNSYGQDCITEKFTSLPGSAAGMISHSRYGWGVQGSTNGASQYFHREYIDALFGENINELGYALVDSKIDNIPFIIGSPVMYWVTYQTNLFGCPAMNVWTDTPDYLSVQLPSAWFVGLNQYTVQTDVSYAHLKIKRDGNLVYEAMADELGTIQINLLEGLSPGIHQVYVTALNHYPYVHTINVVASEMPYVVCQGIVVEDNDGIFLTGEEFQLSFTLKNLGLLDQIEAGTVTLSSNSANLEILESEFDFESIPAGDSLFVENAFRVQVTGTFGDLQRAQLNFITSFDGHQSESYHHITLSAPVLEIINYSYESAGTYPMPGESMPISFRVQNSGSGTAFTPFMMLFSNDDNVSVDVFDLMLPPVGADSQIVMEDAFFASISEEVETGTAVSINYVLSAENGGTQEGSFMIHVGMMTYNFEPDNQDWTSMALTQGFNDQWHHSDARNYSENGYYSMKFGGEGTAGYACSAHGGLVSPEITLGENSTLKFWHWMDAEKNSNNPSQAWDGGNVEMSLNKGDWFLINPVGSYPYTITSNPASPFATGTPVYSGTFDWTEAEFDLKEYSGQARFRFVFGSDAYVTGEGWYVDDVGVESDYVSIADLQAPELNMQLKQNYPNPFNPNTNISFSIPENQKCSLVIYNLKGQLVRKLVDTELESGWHTFTWDGKDHRGREVASGIYNYRLKSGGMHQMRKMMLIK